MFRPFRAGPLNFKKKKNDAKHDSDILCCTTAILQLFYSLTTVQLWHCRLHVTTVTTVTTIFVGTSHGLLMYIVVQNVGHTTGQ